ncbi:MAG: ATP-binding protein [Pseudomonadales bacterium]|nr:ATP-binding protein [Pseudomonadales bacterium]
MNTLFLRVSSGLLSSVLAVGILCYILISGVNTVRHEHFQVNTAKPLFDWMVSSMQQDTGVSYFNSVLSNGSRLQVVPIQELSLDDVGVERLGWGQTLVRDSAAGTHVFKKLSDKYVLVGFFPDLYEDLAQATINIISYQLSHGSERNLQETIEKLAGWFAVDVSVVSQVSDFPSTSVMEAVADSGGGVFRESDSEPLIWFKRLESGEILRVQLGEPFHPFAWPIMLMLFITVSGLLSVAVYFLLDSLTDKLRSLETVASRIARGELDARVKVSKLDALARLGGAFNSMAEHIQRLVLVQREMIHAVSHELRTPVARIRFGVQMIEDCPNQDAVNKQLLGIDNDIQELDELIDEILTYARLEQGGPILSIQDINIVDIVNQVVSEQGSTKPDLKIIAEFQGDTDRWSMTQVEPRYVHRAIQNLVGNATRYCAATVRVVCSLDEATCRVDVEDDGPGIPEEDWEKVFTPFARLDDSRTRSSGGYGLGLSIVRRILYWHGGQAFLGRSDMGGAKFTLVWPRRQ